MLGYNCVKQQMQNVINIAEQSHTNRSNESSANPTKSSCK